MRQAKDGGGRELLLMQWGLVPWFSKDGKPSYSTINARAEGVQTNASFREPFKTRRCLVPASGYFEWTGPKNDRQPHYFTRADNQPIALAGLWDLWLKADADAAAALMKPVNEDVLVSKPVDKAIGNVRHNYAELLK